MLLAYWLLGLLPVAAVGYIIWAHRRKTAQREAARQKRYVSLLKPAREPEGAAPAAAPVPPAAAGAIRVEEVSLPYRLRPRMLAQPHAVLYYLLKTALPDHEIFVHVGIEKAIEVGPQTSGAERDERRRAISQLTVDCAVCTKAMAMVVAIDLVPPGTVDATFKSRCLEAAGVRYLQVDPARLPRRGKVRELVLGRAG